MRVWYLAPVLAFTAIGAAVALAETSPSERHGRHEAADERQQDVALRAQFCTEHYARDAAHLTYLEAKLALTDAQRPLFGSWKDIVLQSAQARAAACAADRSGIDHAPTIVDRAARELATLQAHIATLQAEVPALTSLYQSLSPEQRLAFDPPEMLEHERDGHDAREHDQRDRDEHDEQGWRGHEHMGERGGPDEDAH